VILGRHGGLGIYGPQAGLSYLPGFYSNLGIYTAAQIPPALTVTLPNLSLSIGNSVNIDLDGYFSDATSYSLTGRPAGSGLILAGRVITGTVNAADRAAFPVRLTVTAINIYGSVSDSFAIVAIAGIEEYRCKVQIIGSFYRTQAIKGTYCRRIAV